MMTNIFKTEESMNIIKKNGTSIAVVNRSQKISNVQDMLDLMADIWFQVECTGMIIFQDSLDRHFFDLKTGFAGEILQKFSNYNFKLAIIGDFSIYSSKSLKILSTSVIMANLCFSKTVLKAQWMFFATRFNLNSLTNAKAVAIIAKYHICGHGGIGRRTRFRI
jgi:hypothetical protein